MGQILEYVKMALKNIRNNKGRSFLTMLGIIIGISSVIMVISIGDGVAATISDGLNSIAGGQLYIYSMENEEYAAVEFDDEDLKAIEELPHVKGATNMIGMYSTVVGPKGTFDAYYSAGNEALRYTATEPIIKGGYFTEADVESAAKVCVLRESGAMSMFGTTDVIGKTFEVTQANRTIELRIVGIREDNASAMLNAMNYYEQVEFEMPITTFYNSYGLGIETFSEFYILGEAPEYSKEIAEAAVELLETRHKVRGQGVILLQSFSDSMEQITMVIDTITIFIVFVAAISLLVGGIGVMNIMLVSVTERTREIGIRKALGARTKSILLQFLFESAIITLLGGIIGIIFGYLGACGVCALMGFIAKVSVGTILTASLFSSAVGIFFGIYPARRAAKLSPIEALRHE
ncbi:MAG: ABC transporter permease [Lachnospiraceae bacterium]|nr:ABC transporter permease [Lachnospiraceae bacterium]